MGAHNARSKACAVGAKISYSKPDMMAGKICTDSPTLGSSFAEKFN